MSILLESLKQKNSNADNNGIPNLSDSHFNDEMLSDEWLLEKLKFWKIIVWIFSVGLISASLAFYFYANNTEQRVQLLEKKINELNSQIKDLSSRYIKNVKAIELFAKQKPNLSSSQEEDSDKKHVYKPQFRARADENSPSSSFQKNSAKQTPKATVAEDSYTPAVADGQPVDFDHLSEKEQSQLPELTISSFAVSNNPKKSFVVLNGNFYAEGETIAPHLVLVNIYNKSIVVRFKNKLIRKKIGQ